MNESRRRELEAKLREMMRESQEAENPSVKAAPAPLAACTVIRRRKGTPDKRIA